MKRFHTKNSPKFFSQSVQNLRKIVVKLGYEKAKIILISDKKIWQKNSKFFAEDFLEEVGNVFLLDDPKADEKQLAKVLKNCRNHDLIIAFGSGTISDLCKISSAKLQIPYLVIPSAASMNGYLSRNASITISGHKKTVAATLPIAVLCDLKLLSQAPVELTKAGIGDIFCFYSCWFDWYLSHAIFATKFDEKIFKNLAPKMNFLRKNFAEFSLRDEKFLQLLLEILLLSGLGMTRAGGSYPASQSEHLIAHCLEMKYQQKMQKILHGAQIAVTTLTAAELQQQLLERDSLELKKTEFPQKNLEKFFGKKVAQQCKEEFLLKRSVGFGIAETLGPSSTLPTKNWRKIRAELKKIHVNSSELKKIFSHFKIKTSHKSFAISSQRYQACVANAKFIRNRFTILDILT